MFVCWNFCPYWADFPPYHNRSFGHKHRYPLLRYPRYFAYVSCLINQSICTEGKHHAKFKADITLFLSCIHLKTNNTLCCMYGWDMFGFFSATAAEFDEHDKVKTQCLDHVCVLGRSVHKDGHPGLWFLWNFRLLCNRNFRMFLQTPLKWRKSVLLVLIGHCLYPREGPGVKSRMCTSVSPAWS